MSASPAEVIGQHLRDNSGREDVRVEALITTWSLTEWTPEEATRISTELSERGVFTEPQLVGLRPEDQISVYLREPTPLAAPSPEFCFTHSRDQEAVAAVKYWQDRRRDLPAWRPKERRHAEEQAAAARQRCIDAGIDWDSVSRPPASLRVPDRSQRRVVGGWPSAAAAPVGGRATGAAAAAGFAGGLAGAAVWQWLKGGALPIGRDDEGAWFEGGDGSLFYEDSSGEVFGLADNGGWLAVAEDGTLWGSNGEDFFTWAPDGTAVSLEDDGTLTALSPDGDVMTLGEDGGFYMAGADGAFYTMGADGQFYGLNESGEYFAAPDGSGLSDAELAMEFDGYEDFGEDGYDDAEYDDADYEAETAGDGGGIFDLF